MVSCVWQLKCIIPNENEISDLEIHLSSINKIYIECTISQYMSIRYDVISIFSEGVMWFYWWNRNIVVSSLSLCVCVFSMNWNMSTKFILFNERNSFVCKCKSILLSAISDYTIYLNIRRKSNWNIDFFSITRQKSI